MDYDKLSDNFWRSEFACKCGCGYDPVDAKLIEFLQCLRDFFEKPVTITSGARCPAYNAKVGGGEKSQHLYGKAADFVVTDISPSIVQEYCEEMSVPGLGSYDDFTHVDTRTGHARWKL